jgi:hypothetical protein
LQKSDSSKYSQPIDQANNAIKGLKSLGSSLLKYNLLIEDTEKLCPGVSTFNRTVIK